MNVRVNRSMLQLLGGDPEFLKMPVGELPAALLKKAASPLVEKDGCVVPSQNVSPTWIDDETGTECFWSKFHLEDFLPSNTPLEEVARIALGFVWPLQSSLSSSRLSGTFRMIATIDLSGSAKAMPSCTIRFHRLRPKQTWVADDLESYKDEAVAVCDFTVP